MRFVLLEQPEVEAVLFHPRVDDSYHGPDTRLVSVEVEPGIAVGGRLYPAAPDAPLILFYHGNAGLAADYDAIAGSYTDIGITLLVMDYRGYGTSDGHITASNLVSDAMVVFNGLETVFAQYDLNPSHIYVMGRSLGSVPAIETALHAGERLSGLIIESGFYDTGGLLSRVGAPARVVRDFDEQQDGFGNGEKIRKITTRTLIIHGMNDVLIPPFDGQELFERCAASEKRLILIPNAGHNDILMVGMTQYFKAIREFVY